MNLLATTHVTFSWFNVVLIVLFAALAVEAWFKIGGWRRYAITGILVVVTVLVVLNMITHGASRSWWV